MIFVVAARILAWAGTVLSLSWMVYYFFFYVPSEIRSVREASGDPDMIVIVGGGEELMETAAILAGSVLLGLCAHVATALLAHLDARDAE